MGGQGGQLPTQVWEDQLTLSQPEGAYCPPSFRLLPKYAPVQCYSSSSSVYAQGRWKRGLLNT